MRILVVHNAYRHRGGEDAVVEAETELLQSRGHVVERYMRHNDEVAASNLDAAKTSLWSSVASSDVATLIRSFRPDILHVHNTLAMISPSIYWAASRAGIPVVQTLHNFRLLCPQAMFLREARVCEDCLGKLPWRGVVHRCYRNSTAQSAVVAGMLSIHRALGTWQNKVTRYIALTEFCRRKFVEGGLPEGRISVKPNFVDVPAVDAGERQGFLFAGRLFPEKGISVLADALRLQPSIDLTVVGSGQEVEKLRGLPNLRILGQLPPPRVYAEMRRARALILPSLWYESCPRTLVEAYACGLPVVASRIGALAELIQDGKTGLLFDPGNPADLADKLGWIQANPLEAAAMGRRARALYERQYTPHANYEMLLGIYRETLGRPAALRPAPGGI